MKLHGWGRHPVIDATGHTFETTAEATGLLRAPGDWIAHGMGKSYGDSALNSQVLMTRRLDKLLAFDPVLGTVTCESGVTLAELIDVFLPRGRFLKVAPGTKLITVGGAIASDVHGKNHHLAGCFSTTVKSLKLLMPHGEEVTCSPSHNAALFKATCGGMGLTGLILEATLELLPVQSAWIRETVIRCRNLAEAFAAFEAHHTTSYSVGWIDCLAKGDDLGRSIVMLGEHHQNGSMSAPAPQRLSIPFDCPHFLLNKYSVAIFNGIYYRAHKSWLENRTTSIDAFFFPLDRIEKWHRMYGRRGFTQYQCVLPKAASYRGLQTILDKIARSGIGSFLAVLKLLGAANDNPLSFPMEGYTLALDFKIQPLLFPLLDEIDAMVLDHGGHLYLAKDARMSKATFDRSYPGRKAFLEVRNRYGLREKFNSLQSKRLGL